MVEQLHAFPSWQTQVQVQKKEVQEAKNLVAVAEEVVVVVMRVEVPWLDVATATLFRLLEVEVPDSEQTVAGVQRMMMAVVEVAAAETMLLGERVALMEEGEGERWIGLLMWYKV